jgi:hypothetical protein
VNSGNIVRTETYIPSVSPHGGSNFKGAKINTVTFTRQLPGNSSGAAVSVAINRENVVSAEKNEDGSVMIKMIDGPEIYLSDPWDTVVEGLFLEDRIDPDDDQDVSV